MHSHINVKKQAERDAAEYARAYMSYGEGAGTRRRLIYGTVDYKMAAIPGYKEAFENASRHQNMAKHAKEAEKSARRRNVNHALTRNTKAAMTGKYENLNTAVLILGGAAYFAHRYGWDKQALEAGKKKYRDLKNKFNFKRDKPQSATTI